MGDYAIVARLAAREEQLPEVSRFIVLDEAFFMHVAVFTACGMHDARFAFMMCL